jgi:hypothetical protein
MNRYQITFQDGTKVIVVTGSWTEAARKAAYENPSYGPVKVIKLLGKADDIISF